MYLKYISVLAIQLKIQTARRTFRVNAKKQDYVNVIVKALDEAKDEKKKYIELSARDVARMTGMQPVMSTCCSVMKQMMVEGDKIVKDSRSKNGYDSHLTVKYQVGDRADKKPMFDIRRGKPKGAAGRRKEKAATEKKDLASIAADWLADLGLNADVKEDELLVHGENGVWRIVVDKPGRGKRFSLKNKLFELMTQMDENVEKYSIVVMRDAAYLRDWKRLSAAAKQKINLSLLLCSANGHVKEYE